MYVARSFYQDLGNSAQQIGTQIIINPIILLDKGLSGGLYLKNQSSSRGREGGREVEIIYFLYPVLVLIPIFL
jgi:hypothetical protein